MVWAALVVCWIAFAAIVVADARRGEIRLRGLSRVSVVFVLLAIVWTALAFGSLVDLPLGPDRIYTQRNFSRPDLSNLVVTG